LPNGAEAPSSIKSDASAHRRGSEGARLATPRATARILFVQNPFGEPIEPCCKFRTSGQPARLLFLLVSFLVRQEKYMFSKRRKEKSLKKHSRRKCHGSDVKSKYMLFCAKIHSTSLRFAQNDTCGVGAKLK
jgi:hypothetical protein